MTLKLVITHPNAMPQHICQLSQLTNHLWKLFTLYKSRQQLLRSSNLQGHFNHRIIQGSVTLVRSRHKESHRPQHSRNQLHIPWVNLNLHKILCLNTCRIYPIKKQTTVVLPLDKMEEREARGSKDSVRINKRII